LIDYFLLDVLRWDVDATYLRFGKNFLSQLGPTECAVFAAKIDVKGGPIAMAQKLWSDRTRLVAFSKAIKGEARSSIADAHYMADAEELVRAFD
jgi:hypothetical protein